MKNLEKMESIKHLFFNTPLLELDIEHAGKNYTIYAKLEYLSFSGSIKDRSAYYIYKHSYMDGSLKEGQKIVEATSGNQGIAISALGAYLGHPVTIIMPAWMSEERAKTIEMYGSKLIKITKEEGGFIGSVAMAKKMGCEDEGGDYFCSNQFGNKYNTLAHKETTAKEIDDTLKKLGKKWDRFVAGVGTGGTAMGICEYSKENNLGIKVHPLEPENSPTLKTGGEKIGEHSIQGISDEFIPDLVDLSSLAEIVDADDMDSIDIAQKLNRLGLGVGISSGANLIGALKLAIENPDETIVTVFADNNLRYLSTKMGETVSIKTDAMSITTKINGFVAHKF